MKKQLDQKVAIITGAASGMGRAQSELFVERGALVVLADIDERVESVAAELGRDAIAARLDVSSTEQWASVVKTTIAAHGRVDVLVNTAGAAGSIPFMDTTEEQFMRLVRVNQLGIFLGMQAVIPEMKRQQRGSIVNVGSGAALRASPNMVAYSASKWAVRGLTKGVAVEFAADGIRVNSVHPGVIDTPMLAGNTRELNELLLSKIPLGRLGTPQEIAYATAYLASDESSFMSGSDVTVDGAAYA